VYICTRWCRSAPIKTNPPSPKWLCRESSVDTNPQPITDSHYWPDYAYSLDAKYSHLTVYVFQQKLNTQESSHTFCSVEWCFFSNSRSLEIFNICNYAVGKPRKCSLLFFNLVSYLRKLVVPYRSKLPSPAQLFKQQCFRLNYSQTVNKINITILSWLFNTEMANRKYRRWRNSIQIHSIQCFAVYSKAMLLKFG
jgi:hypothetical protein